MIHKVHELLRRLERSGETRDIADIRNFMAWIFTLPNVTLSDNVMEDPHDLLVPLWQLMTLAGGSCYEQCGEYCVNGQVHMNMMCLGVNVAHEYECSVCKGRWLRHDNGYEFCVSLSLPNLGQVSVDQLL